MTKKTTAEKPKNNEQAVQEWLDAVYYSSSCNDEPNTKKIPTIRLKNRNKACSSNQIKQ